MTVMKPLGLDYAEPATSSHDASRRVQSGNRGRVSNMGLASGPVTGTMRLPRILCAVVLVLADLCAFAVAVMAASLLVRPILLARHAGSVILPAVGPVATVTTHTGYFNDAVLVVGVLLACARYGHYWRRVPYWSELRDLLAASIVALLCGGFLEFSMQRHDSRLFLGLIWVLFPLAALLGRTLARRVLTAFGIWHLPVVVVGCGEMAEQATRALLSEPRLGYRIVSIINPAEFGGRQDGSRWRRVLLKHGAQLLVLALDTNDASARALTESLVRARVPFAAMPRLEGLPVLGFEQTAFFSHDTVMFSYRNNLAQPVARVTKVLFDISVAAILLILATPVLLGVALAVKLDGGPILFAHRRIGASGREFPCFKFRSMVTDSEAVLRRVLDHDPQAAAEWADTCKLRDDPRVTWIGRLLRATSLDELPQLFNVLRLEMSLVGPRPIVRSEVARYAENITYYYEARPGVTGLWQVSGRSDTSYAQRVQLDTWYVKNWTIWHDLAILAKTLPAVLKRQGAV